MGAASLRTAARGTSPAGTRPPPPLGLHYLIDRGLRGAALSKHREPRTALESRYLRHAPCLARARGVTSLRPHLSRASGPSTTCAAPRCAHSLVRLPARSQFSPLGEDGEGLRSGTSRAVFPRRLACLRFSHTHAPGCAHSTINDTHEHRRCGARRSQASRPRARRHVGTAPRLGGVLVRGATGARLSAPPARWQARMPRSRPSWMPGV